MARYLTKIIDGYEFELKFVHSHRIKRTTVVLNSQKLVTIKAPLSYNNKQFEKTYKKFIPWITRHISKAKPKHNFNFLIHNSIDYLGEKYIAKLVPTNDINDVSIILNDGEFVVYYDPNIHTTDDDFFYALQVFYSSKAKEVFDDIFTKYIELTGLKPTKITYKFLKSKWGSCSWHDKISFNSMLLQFDTDVISYVVLHELCHIKEKNHSSKFWQLVARYMPEYKQHTQTTKMGIL